MFSQMVTRMLKMFPQVPSWWRPTFSAQKWKNLVSWPGLTHIPFYLRLQRHFFKKPVFQTVMLSHATMPVLLSTWKMPMQASGCSLRRISVKFSPPPNLEVHHSLPWVSVVLWSNQFREAAPWVLFNSIIERGKHLKVKIILTLSIELMLREACRDRVQGNSKFTHPIPPSFQDIQSLRKCIICVFQVCSMMWTGHFENGFICEILG